MGVRWGVCLDSCFIVGLCMFCPPLEGCVSYNDLNTIDWLFDGEGDYQFEVYRMMRSETK